MLDFFEEIGVGAFCNAARGRQNRKPLIRRARHERSFSKTVACFFHSCTGCCLCEATPSDQYFQSSLLRGDTPPIKGSAISALGHKLPVADRFTLVGSSPRR